MGKKTKGMVEHPETRRWRLEAERLQGLLGERTAAPRAHTGWAAHYATLARDPNRLAHDIEEMKRTYEREIRSLRAEVAQLRGELTEIRENDDGFMNAMAKDD